MMIVGHRGARNEAPENTVAGFEHAFANGCRHFELDIQLSSDHQLVVYHDKKLDRTSGLSLKLKNLHSHFLSTTDARHNTPGWHLPCYIPKLIDVVKAVPDTLTWQFEIKTDERHAQKILIKKLSQLIEAEGLFDKVTITSSHRWLLSEIKRLHPALKTGYVAEWRHNRPVKTAKQLSCELLVLNHRLASPSLLRRAKKSGLQVSCWTVNDFERAQKLTNFGVDSIITDAPSQFIQQLSVV